MQDNSSLQKEYEHAMHTAIHAAEQFLGATAPNPPVGAIALDKNGKILLGAAHQMAGGPHAEAKLLSLANALNVTKKIETLVVTLEPCNHHGKTPPCTEAILRHKNIKTVVIGSKDPNPHVTGGGARRLKEAGLQVIEGVLQEECDFLIRAFRKKITTGYPWITIKAAFDAQGSMIPPAGQKTFTSPAALQFAHELRKRADAIWTGSGTILADNPEFTVRLVRDHPEKKRLLLLSDRRQRIPKDWIERAKKNGFLPHWASSLEEGLEFLKKSHTLEVLVEAGPQVRDAWLQSSLWDESVVITSSGEQEEIQIEFRE